MSFSIDLFVYAEKIYIKSGLNLKNATAIFLVLQK